MAESSSRPRGRPRQADRESASTAKALDKGLLALRAIANEDSVSLNDLALDLDIPQPTLHRLLSTLETHGFIVQSHADSRWSIGVEAFRVGSAFPRAAKLLDIARPILRSLSDRTEETANLGILDQGDAVFIAQHETHHAIRAFFRPGSRSPWHASGIGKTLVAHAELLHQKTLLKESTLEKFTTTTLTTAQEFESEFKTIRTQGFALDDEERFTGMRCISAPVFDANGIVIAGISISGPVARMQNEQISERAQEVISAGQALSKLLGYKHMNDAR